MMDHLDFHWGSHKILKISFMVWTFFYYKYLKIYEESTDETNLIAFLNLLNIMDGLDCDCGTHKVRLQSEHHNATPETPSIKNHFSLLKINCLECFAIFSLSTMNQDAKLDPKANLGPLEKTKHFGLRKRGQKTQISRWMV